MLEGEDKLIKEAQKGKVAAFENLYSHYLAPIYRFIYMKVSSREEAEDLTHEVFVSAWENLKRYRFHGFPFSSWLYQIARNKVIDHYRLAKVQVDLETLEGEVSLAGVNPTIELEIDQEIKIEQIRTAIRKLNHNQQDVIIMRFMEELSHREIAAALGKSEGAVRLIQHRAISEIKKILNI